LTEVEYVDSIVSVIDILLDTVIMLCGGLHCIVSWYAIREAGELVFWHSHDVSKSDFALSDFTLWGHLMA